MIWLLVTVTIIYLFIHWLNFPSSITNVIIYWWHNSQTIHSNKSTHGNFWCVRSQGFYFLFCYHIAIFWLRKQQAASSFSSWLAERCTKDCEKFKETTKFTPLMSRFNYLAKMGKNGSKLAKMGQHRQNWYWSQWVKMGINIFIFHTSLLPKTMHNAYEPNAVCWSISPRDCHFS